MAPSASPSGSAWGTSPKKKLPSSSPEAPWLESRAIVARHWQDQVLSIYSSLLLLKKEMAAQEGPPDYDPELDAKSKTKSAKRNARKKEKRLQAALEKDKSSGSVQDEDTKVEDEKVVQSLTSQIDKLAACANPDGGIPPSDVTEGATLGGSGQDIDKKIRAPKKKVHLFVKRSKFGC